MPVQQKCIQCGMVFPNDDALSRHKSRFCVGVKDSGIGRKVNYSESERTHRPSSRRAAKYQSHIDKKRDEINDWKTRRSMLREIKDMEDRVFHDSEKTRKLTKNRRKQILDHDFILSEYNRLEAQEHDLLRQLSNLQRQPGIYGYQPDGLTNHERSQVDTLKRENARLEQERRLIHTQLQKIMADNDRMTPLASDPYRSLHALRDQRDRTQRSLYTMVPDDRRANSTDVPSLPYLQSPRYGSIDDVRNQRNEYLQSGGHNAAVLSNYADMERKLCQYEPYPWLKDRPEPLNRQRFYPIPAMPQIDTMPDRLTVARNDNHRLQNELNDMRRKYHGLDSRTKKLESTLVTGRSPEPGPVSNIYYPDPPSQVNGYPPMNSLIHGSSRQNDHLRRNRQSLSPTMGRRMSPYPTQPYNPVEGFVIFFDFITNLSSTIDRIRLITCLHHEQTGLGEPTQLDPTKCELSTDERTGETMRLAYVATKQPVPRCPPQQALKVIIEAQVTLKQTPNEPYHTTAWTKLPLFDNNTRLLTGRWKTPLKSLPIQHDERLSAIGSLSTFGSAELYYRLVNLRDAAEQSNAALLPKSKDLYAYPPQDL